jgi:hypothetical protein
MSSEQEQKINKRQPLNMVHSLPTAPQIATLTVANPVTDSRQQSLMPDDHLCQHLLIDLRPGLSGNRPADASSVTSRRHGTSAPKRPIRGPPKPLNIPLRDSQPGLHPAHLHAQLAARAAKAPGNTTQASSIQAVNASLPLTFTAEKRNNYQSHKY